MSVCLLSYSCEQLAGKTCLKTRVLTTCSWQTPVKPGFAQQILLAPILYQEQDRVMEVRPLKAEDSKSTWHSLHCLKIHGSVL